MRLYSGESPLDGKLMARITLPNGERWHVHVRRDATTAEWVNLKVVANRPVPHKANYWIAWNVARRRFVGSSDLAKLQNSPGREALVDLARVACLRWLGEPAIDVAPPGSELMPIGQLEGYVVPGVLGESPVRGKAPKGESPNGDTHPNKGEREAAPLPPYRDCGRYPRITGRGTAQSPEGTAVGIEDLL